MNKDVILGWAILISSAFGAYKLGRKVGITEGETKAYINCLGAALKLSEEVKNIDE